MKKKLLITSIIITIIIIITFTLLFLKKQKIINTIKNNYNDYVITTKDTNMYNDQQEIIGTIYQNTYLELEKINIKTTKDKYFKIKNTNYYILNTDIEKQENKIQSEETKLYYVNLGKKIKTNDTTNFYQQENIKLSVNQSFDFEIIKSDDTYYYINYLNQQYQIKKDEIQEINDIEIEPTSTYISVLYYEKVEENCTEKNCVTTENFKNQLNTLKENGYYTITIEDYKNWINDYINLKEKAILITSTQENINDLAFPYNMNIEVDSKGLEFTETNFKSEKGNTINNKYNIISKTTDEIFTQILNGEQITYIEEKPIMQVHTLPNEFANATHIAVLNYHFFFDPEQGETCPDGNCKTVQDFEQELNYLKQNHYKTLTMEEFKQWQYGEIELPARSVLITIDDGAMGTGTHNGNKLVPLLEKYQSHATLFLISGWWAKENYSSPYLDIESHTYNMHEGNYCESEARGSKLLCSTKEEITEDLKTSIEIIGSNTAFCFPMYVYNNKVLEVLKELDFKLGFVGGDYKASRDDDKYHIPRYHIYRETSLDTFINMIS